ncbi:DNA-directed RNA polymerase I, subunit RPA34.5 [Gongronella butleri]|nr:DNA-directed RNA polymerase I, subunit RPA34.5 [Gongronella butleri]
MAFTLDDHLPEGFTIVDGHSETVFDTTHIEDDDDKELWLIRVPAEVSAEDLCSMTLNQSNKSGKAQSRLMLGNDKYTMYKVPSGEKDVGVSGQEMHGFECLVPSGDGRLTFAPKAVSTFMILDEEISIPDGTALAESIRDRPLEKRTHPEGLKMRFKPYGFDTRAPNDDGDDVSMGDAPAPAKKRKVTKGDDDDTKAKKEKKEKKEKKHKKKH